MTPHDARRPSRFPEKYRTLLSGPLARQNWPAFAHMGATGAMAPPSCWSAAGWAGGPPGSGSRSSWFLRIESMLWKL